jgi:hypothetical protein
MLLASGARAGAQYGSQNSTNAADINGMETAATNDAPTVTATASVITNAPTAAPKLKRQQIIKGPARRSEHILAEKARILLHRY